MSVLVSKGVSKEEKTCPECEKHPAVAGGPGPNGRLSSRLLAAPRCEQAASAPAAVSPHRDGLSPPTTSQNKPLLPQAVSCHVFNCSNGKTQWV